MKKREGTMEKSRVEQKNKRIAGLCRKSSVLFLMIMTIMSLIACGSSEEGSQAVSGPIVETSLSDVSGANVDSGSVLTGSGNYDSADTPVIANIDKENGTITLLNLDIGKRYTLNFDGTTKLYDKYGEGISLAQVNLGDIVDVTFIKDTKHLTSLQLSAKAWSYSSVERYEINTVRDQVTIGEEVYKLTDNTVYVSEGRSIEQMDLNEMDVLTFQGIDRTVLSIAVEKGHGYLRLVNDENFVGGWIEVGQRQIQRITDDMLLTVPEGSYQINISHNGNGGTKSVIINRNQETTLDIGDLTVAEPKYGMVLFSLNPSNAELYIDGSKVDPSQPINLLYGIHQIIAKADGYKSLTQYIRVGQESAGLDVVLDKMDSSSEETSTSSQSETDTSSSSSTSSSSTSSSSTSSSTSTASSESGSASSSEVTTNYYKVYVDAPKDVEIYMDGNYVGISPCSFRKVSGSHVITLRKTGYVTRSYTVQIDDEKKDISFSFADLVKESGTVSDGDGK